MDPHLDEHISIHLSKAACLVLFELLTTSYEQWIEKNSDDSSASPMLVNAAEHEQRVALWHPEGALERTIPEIFSANYALMKYIDPVFWDKCGFSILQRPNPWKQQT